MSLRNEIAKTLAGFGMNFATLEEAALYVNWHWKRHLPEADALMPLVEMAVREGIDAANAEPYNTIDAIIALVLRSE